MKSKVHRNWSKRSVLLFHLDQELRNSYCHMKSTKERVIYVGVSNDGKLESEVKDPTFFSSASHENLINSLKEKLLFVHQQNPKAHRQLIEHENVQVFWLAEKSHQLILCLSAKPTDDLIKCKRACFIFLDKTLQFSSDSKQLAKHVHTLNDFSSWANYLQANSSTKHTELQQHIDQVKSIALETIENALERGEKMELLVEKTDKLNEHALMFEKNSKELKRAIRMRQLKMMIALGCLSIFVLYVILGMTCGFDLSC